MPGTGVQLLQKSQCAILNGVYTTNVHITQISVSLQLVLQKRDGWSHLWESTMGDVAREGGKAEEKEAKKIYICKIFVQVLSPISSSWDRLLHYFLSYSQLLCTECPSTTPPYTHCLSQPSLSPSQALSHSRAPSSQSKYICLYVWLISQALFCFRII